MTDIFRDLCAELLAALETEGYAHWTVPPNADALCLRARAALAEPEPKGPRPTDEELMATMDEAVAAFPPRHPEAEKLCAVEYEIALQVRKARAVLARWGNPTPQPPSGEAAELVELFRYAAENDPTFAFTSADMRLAADLLERLAPQPIPVSERLPGDELCWWYEPDEDEDPSGYGGNWTLLRIWGNVSVYTHWLPAHALPLPSGEVE